MSINYRDTIQLNKWYSDLTLETMLIDDTDTDEESYYFDYLEVPPEELKALLTSYIELIELSTKAGLIYG